MAWPSRIYAATKTLGVYYTADFSDPAVQPTWAAVNTGLGATDCREFHLDPHDGERQFVLLEASRDLYMRESGGNWATILTAAEANTLTSMTGWIYGFCADESVAGRLWVTYYVPGGIVSTHLYAFFTDDYGTSWTAQLLYFSGAGAGYIIGRPRSNGNNVWIPTATGLGATTGIRYTSNKGAVWALAILAGNNTQYEVCLNPLLPNLAYASNNAPAGNDLISVTNGGAITGLQDDLGPLRYDVMWFDLDDADHQRLLRSSTLYVTDDAWATESDGGAIDESPNQLAPYAGSDPDNMFVDLDINHGGGQDHIIATLYGEADTTPTGIAGSNPDGAPYTDSIPYGCGGLAVSGIGVLEVSGNIYTYGVSFE